MEKLRELLEGTSGEQLPVTLQVGDMVSYTSPPSFSPSLIHPCALSL